MMEQPNIKPWLREHLLLITTGYVIRNDKEALLNLIRDMKWISRIALVAGGLLMVIPGTVTDLAGLAVLVVVLVLQRIENKKDKAAASV